MRLLELVEASHRVAATRARREKVAALAELLARLEPAEAAIGVACLSGEVLGGRIGVGPAALHQALAATRPGAPGPTLLEVQAELDLVRAARGPGSGEERLRRLGGLFARSSEVERDFLARWILGELRQGALEGVMEEALARAASVPLALVRRAAMLAGDLVAVGSAALTEGEAGLARFAFTLFRPLQPMLAGSAEDAAEALGELGRAALEYKLDGARIQAHKSGSDVRVFSRLLNDVTPALPEIVEAVRALPARELVLDGEVLALRPNGKPWPFQVTMRRFGRKLDVAALARELPLSVSFFDLVQRDGEALFDRPASERFAALEDALGGAMLVPRLVTDDVDRAEAFLAEALEHGHEGIMAKALDAPYAAGRRGKAWLKVKRPHTLDLVVLAAEWGNGRRQGWLSNLHLGARDEERGGFVMLGKTFKGLTDELLQWQTKELLARELGREGHVVHVAPELVVEIAFGDLQASARYPGGLALRFARVKRYRPDKRAADADTIATARALHERDRPKASEGT